jgi:hypothetical protein
MAIIPPFFLFVGPTKSGTTWVHAYLEARGDIALPRGTKETFFFDKVYERGFKWYESLFPPADDTQPRVEVAPSLFHKPIACHRAQQHVPFARVICIVRNPFDRAVSHYFHYRKHGVPRCSLKEMARRHPDLIDSGMYAKHLPRWIDAFGADNVYLLPYQLLREDSEAFCKQLCDAMQIDYVRPDPSLVNSQVNAARVPRSLFAARLMHSVSNGLRRRGAHALVRSLKVIPIKRWVYSGGEDLARERVEIKSEVVGLSEALTADWDKFLADYPIFAKIAAECVRRKRKE